MATGDIVLYDGMLATVVSIAGDLGLVWIDAGPYGEGYVPVASVEVVYSV